MTRYRALPVEIDIVEWTGRLADIPQEWRDSDAFSLDDDGNLIVVTREGPARAVSGIHDVARGTEGEYYPIRRSVVARKYARVAQ